MKVPGRLHPVEIFYTQVGQGASLSGQAWSYPHNDAPCNLAASQGSTFGVWCTRAHSGQEATCMCEHLACSRPSAARAACSCLSTIRTLCASPLHMSKPVRLTTVNLSEVRGKGRKCEFQEQACPAAAPLDSARGCWSLDPNWPQGLMFLVLVWGCTFCHRGRQPCPVMLQALLCTQKVHPTSMRPCQARAHSGRAGTLWTLALCRSLRAMQ